MSCVKDGAHLLRSASHRGLFRGNAHLRGSLLNCEGLSLA